MRPDQPIRVPFERIFEKARTAVEEGRWFEHLFMAIARDVPNFQVANIWPWREWPERSRLPGLDGRDIGIDLVAKPRAASRTDLKGDLADTVDAAKELAMLPMAQDRHCKARRIVDEAAATVLQLKTGDLTTMAEMPAAEPTVSNKDHPSL